MTVPDPYDLRNDRARDAADVLLFLAEFESLAKLLALREACLGVFESRNRHPWPPSFAPPERWREEFERIAVDLDLETRDFERAVEVLRSFITSVDRITRGGDN